MEREDIEICFLQTLIENNQRKLNSLQAIR